MSKFHVRVRTIYLTRAVLGLPATIIHEFAHCIVAFVLFSHIRSFSIIPRFEGNSIIYGHVHYIPKLLVFCIPISLAPLIINPAVAWLIYLYPTNYILLDMLRWYLILIILFGSVPSTTDIKYALRGLFSLSGIIVFFTVLLLYVNELPPFKYTI